MTITTPGVPNAVVPLVLQNVDVDFDAIYADIQADLQQSEAWSTLLPTSTGAAIMRWLASVTAFMQGGTARALQENYPDTARTPGGTFRAQRLFSGTHLIRSRAGSVEVLVSRTDANPNILTIPAYTQWVVNGFDYFNREVINVTAKPANIAALLHQGTVTTEQVVSSGLPFQRFILGIPSLWNISDDDVWMIDANGTRWQSTEKSSYELVNIASTFRQSTLPDGTVECRLGDGYYGDILEAGNVTFGYCTLDTAANTATSPLVNSTVTCNAFTVNGVTTGVVSPNQDHLGPEFYKSLGPGGAANNQRAVTRDDHRAVALQYDGVVDAVFLGQAENNPSDVRWMNVITVSLITSAPWSAMKWILFKQYLEAQRGIASTYYRRLDPCNVVVDVEVVLYVDPVANQSAVQQLAEHTITTFFTPKTGSLGRNIQPMDIILALKETSTYQQAPNEAVTLLDYVDVVHPSDPVICAPTAYPSLGKLQVTIKTTTRGRSAANTGQIVGM
jgi:hypothetical protein